MKVWSISTTVRNPERIPDFCVAIGSIAGKKWNQASQLEFMYELIRRRFYSPQNMTDAQQEKFDNPDYELSSREAKDIFDTQSYEDPPMRGRTAIAPLRDIGVVRLAERVELTSIGQELIAGKISLQDVLLNYCLKWEAPTPGHRLFSIQNGYNIRPFVGALALITRVNQIWSAKSHEAVGISREEFEVFALTLISHDHIELFAQRIVETRAQVRSKKSAAAKFAAAEKQYKDHLAWCSPNQNVTQTDRNNLKDFGDNAIRYFRQTGFIEYRGAGRYVDISAAVLPQTEALIAGEHYVPIGFDDQESYFDYISNMASFTPPWADKKQLTKVKKHLRGVLKASGIDVTIASSDSGTVVNKIRGEDKEIIELRRAIVNSRLNNLKKVSRQNTFLDELIVEYDQLLHRNYGGYLPKPVALEFNTFKAFLSLNDAISVTANYPTGDDGEPISTAPGGATDLICEYKSFVLSVEVTLSRGNTQWVMEGQPVQRHLREIEDQYSKPAYALFLAPKLHADTVETFWIANVHGYQGDKQRIAALEMPIWRDYLRSQQAVLISNNYGHEDLKSFLDRALPQQKVHANSVQWKQMVNSQTFVISFE